MLVCTVKKERLGIGENILHLLSLRMSKKCQCVCLNECVCFLYVVVLKNIECNI